MNIYSCIDSKNVEKIFILFKSLVMNSKNIDFNFFLLINDTSIKFNIPDFLKDKILIKKFNINNEWRETLDKFNELFYSNIPWCNNDMNFARFFIFEHFPHINRAIYLDWDMIVLSDINNLRMSYDDYDNIIVSELEVEQSILNATFHNNIKYKTTYQSLYQPTQKGKLEQHGITKVLNHLNLTYDDISKNKSFNAGFFIISKNHLENNSLHDFIKLLIHAQSCTKCFNFGTQTILNLIHINKKKFVDKEWNYIPNITDNQIDANKLNIIHWNGSNKPWKNKLDINKVWWYYHDKFKEEISNDKSNKNNI